ncbi:hypothetical protein RSAG8_01856, partial [Rhizoctonia solani AG-8 WAC10335]
NLTNSYPRSYRPPYKPGPCLSIEINPLVDSFATRYSSLVPCSHIKSDRTDAQSLVRLSCHRPCSLNACSLLSRFPSILSSCSRSSLRPPFTHTHTHCHHEHPLVSPQDFVANEFDYLVVGGGTAGKRAYRLSVTQYRSLTCCFETILCDDQALLSLLVEHSIPLVIGGPDLPDSPSVYVLLPSRYHLGEHIGMSLPPRI